MNIEGPRKIGRGSAAGAPRARIINLYNNISFVSMMKREQSTSELWICGIILLFLSLMLSML
jgi:hypothetical protein